MSVPDLAGNYGLRATGVDNSLAEQRFTGIGAWIPGRNMFGPVRGPASPRLEPATAAAALSSPLEARPLNTNPIAESDPSMDEKYVHGYTAREGERLVDQATTLADILHSDTVYPAKCDVLEAGCGVGAQTSILARNSPDANFTAFDLSEESLRAAKERVSSQGITNVTFQQGDIFHLPYDDDSFDHLFLCFVLEHLPDPMEALRCLRRVLKRGGTITAIEGDHGSTYFHPESPGAKKTIQCLVDIQAGLGGNPLVGRQLYPLLKKSGYVDIRISPRMIYVDSGKPDLVEGFTKNTFIAMVEGVKEQSMRSGLMEEEDWDQGIKDLYRTTEEDGTFIYTFFKGIALK